MVTAKNTEKTSYPAPPRSPRPYSGPTVERDIAALASADEQISGIRVSQGHLDAARWEKWLRFDSSILSDVAVDRLEAPGCFITDAHFQGVSILSLSGERCGWRNVVFSGCRIGAAELFESTWDGVHFDGCKIDYLNLRRSRLKDVGFSHCSVGELDFSDANAQRCAFEGSQIGSLNPHRAKLDNVDLRGATIGRVSQLQGLSGAFLTYDQILDLAPTMARDLGIRVV